MSTINTKISNSAYGEWRVDPDNRQDRGAGPVITYTLPMEEIERKYGHIKPPEGKPPMKLAGREEVMKIRQKEKERVKMSERIFTKERLIELCKEHGFGKQAYEKIAEILGAKNYHSVECAVSRFKVRQAIEDETKEMVKVAIAKEKDLKLNCDRQKTLKFYVSTGYENKERAAELAEVIEAFGGYVTCKWWNLSSAPDTSNLSQIGELEIEGIRNADIMIVMMPGKYGTHTEFGVALALGKKIILYASSELGEVPFYWCKGIKQVIGGEIALVKEILKMRDAS